jgi:hypothetical protein
MLFRAIESFCGFDEDDNTEDLNINNVEECFICFEKIISCEESTIQLKNQPIFYKICKCDAWVHISCLHTWYNITEKCPICRTEITHNFYKYYFYIWKFKLIIYMYYTLKYYTIIFFLKFIQIFYILYFFLFLYKLLLFENMYINYYIHDYYLDKYFLLDYYIDNHPNYYNLSTI